MDEGMQRAHRGRRGLGARGGPRAARLAYVVALLAGVHAACISTPLPDPPDLDTPAAQRLDTTVMTGFAVPFVELVGEPLAAAPGATLRVTPLDTTGAAVETVVAADGSFRVTVEDTDVGDALRLQLFRGASRSAPFDVLVTSVMGTPTPIVRPPCVVIPLELEVASGDRASLTVRNDCASAIDLDAQTRVAPSDVATSITTRTLAPGTTGSVTLDASRDVGPLEEVVFVVVTGAVDARYPVSVRVLP